MFSKRACLPHMQAFFEDLIESLGISRTVNKQIPIIFNQHFLGFYPFVRPRYAHYFNMQILSVLCIPLSINIGTLILTINT
jgi:hypothetical protein